MLFYEIFKSYIAFDTVKIQTSFDTRKFILIKSEIIF